MRDAATKPESYWIKTAARLARRVDHLEDAMRSILDLPTDGFGVAARKAILDALGGTEDDAWEARSRGR